MQCEETRKTRLTKQQLINKFIGEMESLLDRLVPLQGRERQYCLETLHYQGNSCSTSGFA